MKASDANPKVHVVDDDDTFRASVIGLLDACGFEAQGYASAEEYLAEAQEGPGCVLLDVNMPGLSGLELQTRLQADARRRPIIFLSGHGDIPMTVQALRAGAEDFLTKPVQRAVLVAAIERAMARDAEGRVAALEDQELLKRFASLTPREMDVFRLIVKGMLNKQIAYEFQTAERTIKAHRSHIMEKLETRSVSELTRLFDRWQSLTKKPD